MSRRRSFSERHGHAPGDAPISIRNDAPHELRGVIVDIAYEAGLSPSPLRILVCRVLRTREDPSNWTEYPNVDSEVRGLVDTCEWFEVYDIIEAIAEKLGKDYSLFAKGQGKGPVLFEEELNRYFRKAGIGWQLVDGELLVRGPEAFEESVRAARSTLEDRGHDTAQREINEALRDLSRRPEPDLTGAVQHAMAALECVAREVTGDRNATLGEILKKHPNLFPRPVDQALGKLWGYASEYGRHLREGREPDEAEAELVVGLASVAATYAAKKAGSTW